MAKKGFTLIEMLVVISLIGILAALALVSFTSSQKQARDVMRKSDLKQYQTVLESYANLGSGFYLSRTSGQSASSILCPDLNLVIEPDISCLEDPRYVIDNAYRYFYISDGTGSGNVDATKYVLWAKLENKTNTYWVVCSSGRSGVSASVPTTAVCPTLN